MKRKYDAVVVTGKYTDRETGKEKNRYLTVGSVLERDDGSLCMKLECLPVPLGDGWINFYTPKTKDGTPSAPPVQAAASTPPPARTAGFEDEIPF